MHVYLETERLRLRRFTPEDAENLLELDSDPEVTRYLHMPGPPTREVVVLQTLPRFLAYYERGGDYGFWAVEEKASGDFLGWFHFRPSARDPGEVELGYRLKRSAWGRGYATELAKAVIRKGFLELGVRRIVAMALTANKASIRVMEKAGLTLEKCYEYEGDPSVKYGLDRESYLHREGGPA